MKGDRQKRSNLIDTVTSDSKNVLKKVTTKGMERWGELGD